MKKKYQPLEVKKQRDLPTLLVDGHENNTRIWSIEDGFNENYRGISTAKVVKKNQCIYGYNLPSVRI